MTRKPRAVQKGTIRLETERDLRRHMRAISSRLNDTPEIARLVFVNPILALQDLDVELSAEVKSHIMDSLRFPPRLRARKAALETELRDELDQLGVTAALPLSLSGRGHVLFDVLGLEPLDEDVATPDRLSPERTAAYADRHPVVAKLAEYERVRHGSLVFQSRSVYQEHKRGEKRHAWIDRVTFDV